MIRLRRRLGIRLGHLGLIGVIITTRGASLLVSIAVGVVVSRSVGSGCVSTRGGVVARRGVARRRKNGVRSALPSSTEDGSEDEEP